MKEEAIKYLKVLELEPGADFQSVKNSYKLLSMAWHPDRFSSEKHKTIAEDKQKKINAAYQWLKKNQEILFHLNSTSPNKNTKQKSHSNFNYKAKKQSTRKAYNRSSKSSYNSRVKTDDHYLIFEDKKYDINLIHKAILNIQSRKYIRMIGYILFSAGWILIFSTFVAFYYESDDLGFTFLLIGFFTFIISPFFLFRDIINIDLILNNKAINTAISYKVFPGSDESVKKLKIAKNLVNEINNVIGNK